MVFFAWEMLQNSIAMQQAIIMDRTHNFLLIIHNFERF